MYYLLSDNGCEFKELKTLIQWNQITSVVICLLSDVANAKEMAIATKSVAIENIVSYVIEKKDRYLEQDSLSLKKI